MTYQEVLKLKLSDLDTMKAEQLERVAYVCRSIRSTVYGIESALGHANWEREMGMTVNDTKIHTLGLLYQATELLETN